MYEIPKQVIELRSISLLTVKSFQLDFCKVTPCQLGYISAATPHRWLESGFPKYMML